MAMVIPFVMLAGAAVSAMGAVSAAQAQKTASNYNAALSERNALLATQQAEADVAMQQRHAAQVQGSMVAGYGASGVTLEGSPLDVLASSAAQAELDTQTIRYRGNLKAMGYHDAAELDRMAADTAEQQGYFNAASSFLMGAGQAAASYGGGARLVPGTRTYA